MVTIIPICHQNENPKTWLFPPLSPFHSWQTLCCPGTSFRSHHFDFVLTNTSPGCSQRRRILNNEYSSQPFCLLFPFWTPEGSSPGTAPAQDLASKWLEMKAVKTRDEWKDILPLLGCLPHADLAGVQIKLLILGSHPCSHFSWRVRSAGLWGGNADRAAWGGWKHPPEEKLCLLQRASLRFLKEQFSL